MEEKRIKKISEKTNSTFNTILYEGYGYQIEVRTWVDSKPSDEQIITIKPTEPFLPELNYVQKEKKFFITPAMTSLTEDSIDREIRNLKRVKQFIKEFNATAFS